MIEAIATKIGTIFISVGMDKVNNKVKGKFSSHKPQSIERVKKTIRNKEGFVFACLCLNKNCEEKIKEETKASSRCIPFEGGLGNYGKCIYCGKDAPNKVFFA